MEIANPHTHRLLAYIAAVNDQGASLPVELADEYGKEAERAYIQETQPAVAGLAMVVARMQEAIGGRMRLESWVGYLERLGWAMRDTADGEQSVVVTRLGRAVLRHLEQSEVSPESAVGIAVKADDPLSYAQVIGRIASHQDALLVDAYLDADVAHEVPAWDDRCCEGNRSWRKDGRGACAPAMADRPASARENKEVI